MLAAVGCEDDDSGPAVVGVTFATKQAFAFETLHGVGHGVGVGVDQLADLGLRGRSMGAGQPGDDGEDHEHPVDDAGPGIAPDLRDRVCQPFYQVDGSATRQVGGAGLGLAIAERTCALHGGTLRIGRSPAGGARVVLGVPTRPDP